MPAPSTLSSPPRPFRPCGAAVRFPVGPPSPSDSRACFTWRRASAALRGRCASPRRLRSAVAPSPRECICEEGDRKSARERERGTRGGWGKAHAITRCPCSSTRRRSCGRWESRTGLRAHVAERGGGGTAGLMRAQALTTNRTTPRETRPSTVHSLARVGGAQGAVRCPAIAERAAAAATALAAATCCAVARGD